MRVIVSGEYPYIVDELEKRGYDCVCTQANPLLPNAVKYHSDMQFLRLEKNKAFVLKNSNISLSGYQLVKTMENPQDKYPKDCLVNCLVLVKKVFGNKNSVDENLLEYLCQNAYEFFHVNQGYTACSCVKVDNSHVITADIGIKKVLEQQGISVLPIENGHISLPSYDYGFIGGCFGKVGGKIIFTGSLKFHPNGEQMRKYIAKCNLEIVELFSEKLLDIGGIVQVD